MTEKRAGLTAEIAETAEVHLDVSINSYVISAFNASSAVSSGDLFRIERKYLWNEKA